MYKVLLVDDEEIVTEGLSRFIPWEELGFTVIGTATNVTQALALLQSEQIDLVITDIEMPNRNGLELLHILHSEYPHAKAIILSGYSEFAYAQQAMRLGTLDYLTKPINFATMRTLLDSIRRKLDDDTSGKASQKQMKQFLADTLVTNLSNGYPYDASKAATCLDTNAQITVVQIITTSSGIQLATFKSELQGLFSHSHAIRLADNELLVVLENMPDTPMLQDMLGTMLDEHYGRDTHVFAGMSEVQNGYKFLRTAFLQANKAMRYQNASGESGVLRYSQIKDIVLEPYDIDTKGLVEMLTVPEQRQSLIPAVSRTLDSGLSLAEARRFCAELLIEFDSPMRNFSLPDYQYSGQFKEALIHLLECDNLQEIHSHIELYIQQLIDQLERAQDATYIGNLIDRVLLYINQHFAEAISLTVAGEKFYVSPGYLSRLFKKKTGINFTEYLTTVRMERAKVYLTNQYLKIYNVAEMVGYENPHYFAHLFKQATGQTPQEYRNSH